MTISAGMPTFNVSALAIDPSTPATLLAGTDTGVFKSIDGGQSWVAANGGLIRAPQVKVNAIAIDPVSTGVIYAATSGGVYKTIDGAANWTAINAGLVGQTPHLIVIDPASHSTLYVGVEDDTADLGNGVFRSTDAGATWTRIYRTTPYGDGGAPSVAAIVVD